MEIKLDKYTLRFDPSEIRISIDGEKIDIGARTKQVLPELYNRDIAQEVLPKKKQ